MGKKKRYRLRAEKFGRKYGLKYGIPKKAEEPVENETSTPDPVVMAVTDPVVESPAIADPKPPTLTASTEPVAEPPPQVPKRNTSATKSSASARKTTRKRATKAKTKT